MTMFTKPLIGSSLTAALASLSRFIPRMCRTTMGMSSSGLPRIASFPINSPSGNKFSLVISNGSVVNFIHSANPSKSAIVNAANEQCLGGGGVDGAISSAGGPDLLKDRTAIPIVKNTVRCPTGEARITGPGEYGKLCVPYVIHAVGPNYLNFEDCISKGDELLRSAYMESLEKAKEEKLEAVAFSLLSSGIYRGTRTKEHVLGVGMKAICDFDGYDELNEVHVCAFSSAEKDALLDIASELGLKKDAK